MKPLLLAFFLYMASGLAAAYEPDVTQQREEFDSSFPEVGYLVPSGKLPPEEYGPPFQYLARFGRYPSFEAAFEWALVHKERPYAKEHTYVLSSWRLDRSDRKAQPQRLEVKEIEIPQDLAATIYSIWANAILDARYARERPGLDGTSYWFSTSLHSVGWLHATTWSPKESTPPGRLVAAAEDILTLSRAARPDPSQTHERLRSIQSKLREYLSK
jgi:hypothetical protein